MFLNNLFETPYGQSLNKFARESSTFNAGYLYWREQLFERIMRLFVWENTDPVEPKEIEQRLLINGHCGIMMFQGELTAFYGSFNGVTKYLDEWTHYNVHCPIYSARKEIGKEIAIIDNTAIRNGALALVHHYAILLAHTEVTLINLMVNARDAGGIPVASDEKTKQSIHAYQAKVFNGQYGVVSDPSTIGLSYVGADRHTQQDIGSVLETREKLLKSFYSDIGVRAAFEKRNNAVTSEVEADTSLLLLNISDMLHQRERGAERVNALFGTNWSVHVAEEINYELDEVHSSVQEVKDVSNMADER